MLDPVRSGAQVVLTGTGVLSSVSSGTDTMEVNEDQYATLFGYAQALLLQSEMDDLDGDELNSNQRAQTHWRNRASEREMALPALKRINH